MGGASFCYAVVANGSKSNEVKVVLPGYVHSILHTNEYYSSVNELLAQADTRQEAIDALAYIRQQLLGGALA